MKLILVAIDGASAPEVAHVVSEHYLGYGVDAAEVAGVEVRDAVEEGWWAPDVNAGRVHDHPARPGRGWSATMHRSCERVYTARPALSAG